MDSWGPFPKSTFFFWVFPRTFENSCNPEAEADDLEMSISDWGSVDRARTELCRSSHLDPSQADAVVAALSRELVLIQG